MSEKNLTPEQLKQEWRALVPKMYGPDRNDKSGKWANLRRHSYGELFDDLEKFIFNGKSMTVLEELRKMGNDPSVCGEVLPAGTATYTCLECSVDTTHVLCVHCFMRSAHRDHKYKIVSRYAALSHCDCGDAESWKKDPFCETHLSGLQNDQSTVEPFPEVIKQRASVAFQAILEYCCEIMFDDCEVKLSAKDKKQKKLSSLTSGRYCVVLYGDDVTNQSEEKQKLVKWVRYVSKCSISDANGIVDELRKAGRVAIHTNTYKHCSKVKTNVDQNVGSVLPPWSWKVSIVPVNVLAQQRFAFLQISWLDEFVYCCKEFRMILSDIVVNVKIPQYSIVERFFRRRSELCKEFKKYWRQLLINSMTLDFDSSTALAEIIWSNYHEIHLDGGWKRLQNCFTLKYFYSPKLSHHLIAHYDALTTLWNAVIKVFRNHDVLRKTPFHVIDPFTANLPLSDMLYLLELTPKTWTDELRQGFLKGVSEMLKLIGMHSVCAIGDLSNPPWRRCAIHLLQSEISTSINAIVQWCGSDKVVFAEVFKSVLEHLYKWKEVLSDGPVEIKELGNHRAASIKCNACLEEVSTFSPLSNFLAGLFLLLEKHEMDFHSDFSGVNKLTLEGIIEPVLRKQVMLSSQRNDPDELYLVEKFNESPMFDGDIALLQVGAAFIKSDEFLINMLNKFDLLDWASQEHKTKISESPAEDAVDEIVMIVEDFLWLLIATLGERYVLGVGQVTRDDILKKEIIQQLCVEPLSYSQLERNVLSICKRETGLEFVIDDVAEFSTTNHGKVMGKPKQASYAEYNAFFYHYTKDEMKKSQEAQCNRRRAAREPECCPPPKLPQLTKTFTTVVNLLQCDVMLHIMRTVLESALNPKNTTFSEFQLHEILHLIGYALQEQESGYYPFFDFTGKAPKFEIYELLHNASTNSEVVAHRPLLTWTLTKFKKVAGFSCEITASPIKYSNNTDLRSDKERIKAMATIRKDRILAEMAALQKKFCDFNANDLEEAMSDTKNADPSNSENSELDSVASNPGQFSNTCHGKSYTCFICHKKESITSSGPHMVFPASVRWIVDKNRIWSQPFEASIDFLTGNAGIYVCFDTCGHAMHVDCWEEYTYCAGPNSKEKKLWEFSCGMCKRLSNTVIPLIPSLPSFQPTSLNTPSFHEWVAAWKYYVEILAEDNEAVFEISEISNDVKNIIHVLAQNLSLVHPIVGLENIDGITPFLLWASISKTIRYIHRNRMSRNAPLFGSFAISELETLESLSRLSTVINMVYMDLRKKNLGFFTIKILSKLLVSPHDSDTILDWDLSAICIILMNSMPNYSKTQRDPSYIETSNDHILKLTFLSQIVKVLLSIDVEKLKIIDAENQSDVEEEDAISSDCILRLAQKFNIDVSGITADKLWRSVKNKSVNFLSRCALYFHFVTGVPVPVELYDKEGVTFKNLCRYLGLASKCDELLDSEVVAELTSTWADHPKLQERASIMERVQRHNLVDLPEDYNELVEITSYLTCPNNGFKMKNPFMCLYCGVVMCDHLCSSCSDIFGKPALVYHAETCREDYFCIFLDIDHCRLGFLVNSTKLYYKDGPYVDQYGSTDFNGRGRGNPKKLSTEEYKKIKMWWQDMRLCESEDLNFKKHVESDYEESEYSEYESD